jgi:hypothetical protein
MKDLLKDFTSMQHKVGEEEVDHVDNGRINFKFNLFAETV